jgi:hypothetical protein
MKLKTLLLSQRLLPAGFLAAIPLTLVLILCIHNTNATTEGMIGEYTTSGATVNSALVTGLTLPTGIAISGGDLFVENLYVPPSYSFGTVGEYTTSGATVNSALISGVEVPVGIAVSGGDLFVGHGGTVGE